MAVIVVAAALAGCGSSGGAVSSQPKKPPVTTTTPASAGCPATAARHAAVTSVSAAGRINWQAPLTITANATAQAIPPVINGPVGYFAQDGVIHALRLADGSELWSRAIGRDTYGMWEAGSVLAVLTDQVGPDAVLTGLDTTTGKSRWQVKIGGQGLHGDQAPTGDGGLAWLRDGHVEVVDLATGRVRWSVPSDGSAVETASGLVLASRNGELTGLDQRSGTVRWAQSAVPAHSDVHLLAGSLLVTSAIEGGANPTAMVALDPATGRVRWQFDAGNEVTPLGAGPGGLLVATFVPREVYLLDPNDGKLSWKVATLTSMDVAPDISAQDVTSVEGGGAGYPTIALVDRSVATGAVHWQVPLAASPAGQQTVLRDRSLVVIAGDGRTTKAATTLFAFNASDGTPVWQAPLPEFVAQSPISNAGAYLVQSASLTEICADSAPASLSPSAAP